MNCSTCRCRCFIQHVKFCMYVCTHLYVCISTYAYVCVRVCMQVCMCKCMYVCMYVCVYVCMHASIHVLLFFLYVRMYACMYVCTPVRAPVYIYIYIYIYMRAEVQCKIIVRHRMAASSFFTCMNASVCDCINACTLTSRPKKERNIHAIACFSPQLALWAYASMCVYVTL